MRMKVSNYIAKLLVQNGITDVFYDHRRRCNAS